MNLPADSVSLLGRSARCRPDLPAPNLFKPMKRHQLQTALRTRRSTALTTASPFQTVAGQRCPPWSNPFTCSSWSSSSYSAYAGEGDRYAPNQPARRVNITDLLRYGPCPLLPDALVESAEVTRRELPHRLARRVRAHHGLPYLPASNPQLTRVLEVYRTALAEIESIPPIKTLADNEIFVKRLGKLVDDAADVIPLLAKGFQESRRYLSDEQITTFLDRAIRNRIAIRMIAEQHIALTSETNRINSGGKPSEGTIGIVDTKLQPHKLINSVGKYVSELCEGTYGQAPEWIFEGDIDARCCYVGMHLEYIMTEILKNAFRATVEHHRKITGSSTPTLPPILITLATSTLPSPPSPTQPPLSTLSPSSIPPLRTFSPAMFSAGTASSVPSADAASTLCIRVRDGGGGIPPKHLQEVFSYAFTTVGRREVGDEPEDPEAGGGMYSTMSGTGAIAQASLQTGLGTIAGLGYGLPMARTYARYLGGALDLVSMHGAGGGVDAYITLKLGQSQW